MPQRSSTRRQPPLIVIAGPTASGKSDLSLELAEKYRGEIICADSRTVYRGMDIGTAKPSMEDQLRVPHHLLDVVNPNERFTAADFQRLSRKAIDEIRARGNIPFVVGGTGLYIDGLLLDYKFGPPSDAALRGDLMLQDTVSLKEMIKKQRITTPLNYDNKRHLVRALEQRGINSNRSKTIPDNTIVVAISTDKLVLNERIRQRADEIFNSGIVDETQRLVDEFGWDSEAFTGNIYPIIHDLMDGKISLEKAKELFIIKDRQLAKRQITWLKRNDFVLWMELQECREYLNSFLADSIAKA